MRKPPENKRSVRVMNMKQMLSTNNLKKSPAGVAAATVSVAAPAEAASPVVASKPDRDYISETISFVIKGKLTPIKPPIVKKATKRAAPISKKVKLSKLPPAKVQNVKTASKKAPPVKKPPQPSIDNNKKSVIKKIVKSETLDGDTLITRKKPQAKPKAQQKSEGIDNKTTLEQDDIKTKQTIEKLLREANRALKRKTKINSKSSNRVLAGVKVINKKVATTSNRKLPVARSCTKLIKQLPVDLLTVSGGVDKVKKSIKKRKSNQCPANPDDTSTSDDQTLNELRKTTKKEPEPAAKAKKGKAVSKQADNKKSKKKIANKANLVLIKKRVLAAKVKDRKMKLFGFWNGPKRHRVASLNALAKVHCLYENETRGSLMDTSTVQLKKEPKEVKKSEDEDEEPCTRTLRSVPGSRAIGKHWDMHDTTSSSEEDNVSDVDIKPTKKVIKKEPPNKTIKKEPTKVKKSLAEKRKRNRPEIIMDLKDMVVRKRMASLNASAILAASYSVEKRSSKSPKSDSDIDSSDYFHEEEEEDEPPEDNKSLISKIKKEEQDKMVEVQATPANKKVAVILNQDTDVTITGMYVNSTTRSTHHEGYCSIAGMQYRISATSHTQTAATAVATETLLQSSSSSAQENSNSESLASCKSYTPLDALSNMQPPPGPGIHNQQMGPPQHVLALPPQHRLSPSKRHTGCASAFSAPYQSPLAGEPGYAHGYYQPAGPLITVPHGLTQPPPTQQTKPGPPSDPTPSSPPYQPPPAPTSTNGDSSDSEVIITSITAAPAKDPPPPAQLPAYRYPPYPAAPPSYAYSPLPYYQPAPAYAHHHDLCYTAQYLQHKYQSPPPPPHPTFRRYLPPGQYYTAGAPPPEVYAGQASGQMVTAAPGSTAGGVGAFQPSGGPQPAILETYAPPPTLVEGYPTHYYQSNYVPPPPPPPSCFSHQSAGRSLPYMNATYQSCPCPMQTCPKNGLTGPLTGDGGKRSTIASIGKDSMPLPPVALALPLEPVSATGPPSPARGSAGMPPPPSPAGATYQPDAAPVRRKARVGKAMVRNNFALQQQNTTMLLMCNPNHEVKREIESPKEIGGEESKAVRPAKAAEGETALKNEAPSIENVKEELEPCVNTVAENVKVKNMKRKLSTTTKEGDDGSVTKQIKTETKSPTGGSYKNLIKRDTNTVKINNGRRKLITENGRRRIAKTKKKATKRKLNNQQKETCNKRLKSTKPLSASNQQQKSFALKENRTTEPILRENKEPAAHLNNKKKVNLTKNSKNLAAPAILDNLIAKNSIDRTIETVISEANLVRTSAIKTCNKKEPVLNNNNSKKSTNKNCVKNGISCNKVELKKSVVLNRRKSKCKEIVPQPIAKIQRKSLQLPRWSNGWMWEGDSYEAKVFLNSDETTVVRKCYSAMRHDEGDIIEVRDCVLLKAGPRKNDLPFVAKIAHLWENPDDGEMMMSLLWYYRPEHTDQGRLPADQPDEVFASRHKDSNSVACIDDKCYVLTFHEYCRYRKELRRVEENMEPTLPSIPLPEPYPRITRLPPTSLQISADMIFFCRRVYDFRQKRIIKNPS